MYIYISVSVMCVISVVSAGQANEIAERSQAPARQLKELSFSMSTSGQEIVSRHLSLVL